MPSKFRAPERLATERLVLRRHRMDDLPAFTTFIVDREATRYLLFPEDKKTEEGARWMLEMAISAYDSEKRFFSIAIADPETDVYIGSCGLSGLDERSFEIYYTVMPARQGEGIGTDATRSLVDYALNELGIEELVAFVWPDNEPSIRVAEKVGFARGEMVEHMGRVGWRYALQRGKLDQRTDKQNRKHPAGTVE